MSKIKAPPTRVGNWRVLGQPERDPVARQMRWCLRCTVCGHEIKTLGQSLRQGRVPWCETCDPITYAGAHGRVYRTRGRASQHLCMWTGCDSQATDWALMIGWRPKSELVGVERASRPRLLRYSAHPGSYAPMCRPCHSEWDDMQVAIH